MAETQRSQVDHRRRAGRWRPLARAEEIEYDRILFFSDAVFAIAQPVLAQYLWLLALVSALVLRRLEPPEAEPMTAERGDHPG